MELDTVKKNPRKNYFIVNVRNLLLPRKCKYYTLCKTT